MKFNIVTSLAVSRTLPVGVTHATEILGEINSPPTLALKFNRCKVSDSRGKHRVRLNY